MQKSKLFFIIGVSACICFALGFAATAFIYTHLSTTETASTPTSPTSSKPNNTPTASEEEIVSPTPSSTQPSAQPIYDEHFVKASELEALSSKNTPDSLDYLENPTANAEKIKADYLNNPNSYLLSFYGTDSSYSYSSIDLTLYSLSDFDEELLDLARNEIYATYGYIFDSSHYQNIFTYKSWYTPYTQNVTLSDRDSGNVAFINWYKKYMLHNDISRYHNDVHFSDGYRFKINEPISLDINGDDIDEVICVKSSSSEGEIFLTINDQVKPISTCFYDEEIWIVDIDPTDHLKEIVIFDHGPSSDPVDSYYYFENGSIHHAGDVEGHLNDSSEECNNYIKDKTLYSVFRSDILDTHRYRCSYQLDANHQLVMQPMELTKIHIPLFILEPLDTYSTNNLNSINGELKAYSSVVAIATDAHNWIKLQDENGKIFWIYSPEGYFSSAFEGVYRYD